MTKATIQVAYRFDRRPKISQEMLYDDEAALELPPEQEGGVSVDAKAVLGLRIPRQDFLTPEREKALWQRRGDADAKAEILTAHLPLCRSLARAAYFQFSKKIDLEELEAQAQLCMVKVYDRYDPDSSAGARFCSYAAEWVRYDLSNFSLRFGAAVSIEHNKPLKSLRMHWGQFNKISAQEDPQRSTFQHHQRIATLMAERTVHKDFDVRAIAEFEAAIASRSESLSMEVGDKGASSRQDFLQSAAPGPETLFERAHDYARALEAFKTLSEREQDILRQRILCDDDDKVSLQDLAAGYGLSLERVRQIEAKALLRLREILMGTAPRTKSSVAENLETLRAIGFESPQVARAMSGLTAREQHILRAHAFEAEGGAVSYHDLAAVYGTKPDSIRQIENRALRKLCAEVTAAPAPA